MPAFARQDNWAEIVPRYGDMALVWTHVQPPQGSIVYRSPSSADDAYIRMNDFPDEPLYTLVVSGVDVIHFNEWPARWAK